MDAPRPSPRTNRARLVPHPVLIGHAACNPRLAKAVEARSADLSPHHMAAILWSLARCAAYPARRRRPALPCTGKCWHCTGSALAPPADLGGARSTGLSPSTELVDSFRTRIVASAPAFTATNVADCLWAFTRLRHSPRPRPRPRPRAAADARAPRGRSNPPPPPPLTPY